MECMSVCILEPIILFTARMWTSKTGLLSMMGREWGGVGWGGVGWGGVGWGWDVLVS